MADQGRITQRWELTLDCGHTVTVVPHSGGAKVTDGVEGTT